ncbi:MAG: CocE/NonD family hydrolase [Blautia sp.]|nr:CocE/NonD family hydrolase [Blautia sp.]
MSEWKQLWVKPRPIDDPEGNYNGFNPSVTALKAGYRHPKGDVALTCDVVWERDTAVQLRDGTTIYTDIYRPATKEPVPVVISWSPYGKSNIDLPWVYNEGDLSHLQKEEGVDPALWCAKGYAVAHPDARGFYMSEGNIYHWGTNEGKDIYDYVEWLAQQSWCSGRIGMAGNSYLTIAQWFAADQQPPHLTAIAPWEGQTDAYREVILQGGIIDNAFPRQAISVMHSNNFVDDMATMAEEYPVMNSYWENKRAVLRHVTIPAYIVASYTNPIHTPGTFRAYRELGSSEKWLRIHNSTEWVDFYRPENQADLLKFFDHYLKGEDNGWEKTPAVRYSVLDPGGKDETGIEDTVFPPTGTEYRALFADAADMTLKTDAADNAVVSWDGKDPEGCLLFRYTFTEDLDVIGYSSLRLFLEGKDCEDMDLFAEIGKEAPGGGFLDWECTPPNRYMGPFPAYECRLRLSMRALDPGKSVENIPVQSFAKPEPVRAGEIAEADLAIRPMGVRFHAGETLLLRIGNEFASFLKQGRQIGKANTGGTHILHTGEGHPSCLVLPVRRVG